MCIEVKIHVWVYPPARACINPLSVHVVNVHMDMYAHVCASTHCLCAYVNVRVDMYVHVWMGGWMGGWVHE